MKTINIYRFGAHGDERWYELNGRRKTCDERTIMVLWNQWIMNPTAKRADDDRYTIFEVIDPPLKLMI
jgi:hypothetical protein